MSVSARLVRNSFFQFWATLATAVSSFVLSMVLARGLGPTDYGAYSFLIWLVGVGATLANLGLNTTSAKFISEFEGARDHGRVRGVLRLAVRGRAVASLVVSIALVPISIRFMGDVHSPGVRFYPLLVSLTLLPYALHQAFQSILRGFQRYDFITYALLAALPIKTIAAIAIIRMGYGILQLLLLEFFTWGVAALVGLAFTRWLTPNSPEASRGMSTETRRAVARYTVVATALVLVDFVINQRSEVFFLELYWSKKEVGYFNLAFSISSYPMVLVPGVLGQVLMPAISEQFGRGDKARLAAIYVTSARYLMMLAFPLAAGGIALARPLVLTVFGARYSAVALPAQILFAGAAWSAVSASASGVVYGTGRLAFLLAEGLLMVPASLFWSILLIPRYGVVGAALAHAGGALFVPVTIWYVSRKLKVAWPLKDAALITVASGGMALGVVILVEYLHGPALIPTAVVLGGLLYFAQLTLFRVLRHEDWQLALSLARSRPFARWLERPIRTLHGA